MRRIDVAITGFGGIGRQVARLLRERHAHYRQRYGVDVRITGVCGASAGLVAPAGLDEAALANRQAYTAGMTGAAFIDSVPADVLFEASPTDFRTGGAALAYIRAALRRRMHIIAISKGALALDYPAIRAEATRQGVALKVSGAAGSALPTVDFLQYDLAGCQVSAVAAIVTATTNLILSEMTTRDCSFEDALAEAQRLGIAEADPSLDIEGWDTACKIAILCNAAFGTSIDVLHMPRQGIGGIRPADIRQWRSRGLTPRLVGQIDRVDGQYQASVRLGLYNAEHPFAKVHGQAKAINVSTDLMGSFTIVNDGASPFETAASALKDLEHVLLGLHERGAAER